MELLYHMDIGGSIIREVLGKINGALVRLFLLARGLGGCGPTHEIYDEYIEVWKGVGLVTT